MGNPYMRQASHPHQSAIPLHQVAIRLKLGLLRIRCFPLWREIVLVSSAHISISINPIMGMWWKDEKKGQPIAVATPVDPHPAGGGMSYATPTAPYSNMMAVPTYPNVSPSTGGGDGIYRTAPEALYGSMGERSQTHKTFIVISLMAGLTGVNNIIAQILALTYPGNNVHFEIILRIYLIGFCVLMTLNESERIPIIKQSAILYSWVGRGLFYCFLGVLGQNLYDVGYDNRYRRNGYYGSSSDSSYNRSGDYNGYYGPRMPSTEDFCEWYIWMTSFCMFLMGVLYIILGAMCMQRKLEHLREQYNHHQTGGQVPSNEQDAMPAEAKSYWRV